MGDHFVDANKIDERLAHLPDDLRKVAEEFLTLHQAWDTGFEAHNQFDTVTLIWYGGEDLKWATCRALVWRDRVADVSFEAYDEGSMSRRMMALRRSADFAEFVRRFGR